MLKSSVGPGILNDIIKGIVNREVGELWTPSQLSSHGWWDSSDGNTISESGGAVSQLDDKSGNGRHLEQSDGASRPITGTRTINGLNGLDFDGSDDFIEAAGISGVPATSYDFFYVADLDLAGDGYQVYELFQDGLSGNFGELSGASYIGVATNDASTTSSEISGSTYTTPFLYNLRWNGSTLELFQNGTSQGTTALSGNITIDTVNIGANGEGAYWMDGIFGEAIWCPYLSVANRQNIEGYISHKWGFEASLPVSHPHKSEAPTA
jgi:hypothetical protein